MSIDEIIEQAIQGHSSTRDAIRWAMHQEREACAKVCIKLANKWTRLGAWGENNEFHECAEAIRARGEK